MRIISGILALTLIGASTTGCSVQTPDAKAEAGRTESTEVQEVKIPYDPQRKKFVLVVEPFQTSQSVITWTDNEGGAVPIGDKMAAQLTTALSNVGNFVLFDKSTKKVPVRKGERGPFVLRATLTELTENAETESESTGGSLGGVGLLTGIAGAVTGNRALGWTGYGLAVANPTYGEASAMKKGVVAFDIQIVEKNTGRIVKSFSSAGTFKSAAVAKGGSLFGIGRTKTASASSAIGQALRIAMNDAVQKTYDSLAY
jgi:curli biogenesis system outer membrane secretion channel CsgG